MTWLLTFSAMFATDAAWALYVSQVRDGNPFGAAMWALFLFVLGAFVVTGYTRDRWLIVPAAIGAFVGTYCGVLWQ